MGSSQPYYINVKISFLCKAFFQNKHLLLLPDHDAKVNISCLPRLQWILKFCEFGLFFPLLCCNYFDPDLSRYHLCF